MQRMVTYKILLEFNILFPEEDYNKYLSKLYEIPKKYLLDITSTFLRFRINDERVANLQELLGVWFRKNNETYANDFFKKIVEAEAKNKNKYVIINEITNLLILEAGLNSEASELKITETELEILFFKIYLAYNQQSTEKEKLASSTTEKLEFPLKLNALLLSQSFANSDLIEYDLKDSFVVQTAKAILFFEDIIKKETFKSLISAFYNYYEVDDYKNYIKRYLALSSLIFKSKKEGKIDISISEGPDKDKSQKFLEKFALSGSYEENDIDFKLVRNKPLLKIDDNKFRIIFPLFVIEKLYNGLYFKLKEINDSLSNKEKVKNLRSEITYQFSEKRLLYQLIERSFGNKYVQKSGQEIDLSGVDGFVDYYIRNGNKVFLFESKDILINAEIKQSYDFGRIEQELKKKLYFEEKNNKKVPKAILQIINSIKTLLDGQFSLDEKYKPNSLKIYPIIILHNRQLEILGINQLIKSWFIEELKLLADESYNIDKIKDIIIMNIDSFIIFSDRIKSKEINLTETIDNYLNYTDQASFDKKKFKNQEEVNDIFRNSCISFSGFMKNKHEWKLPSIFGEKGYSLFSPILNQKDFFEESG